MISIFITSGYLLQSVTEEKENRVVEIVLELDPLDAAHGRQDRSGLGGAGLTQVAIWVRDRARGTAAAVEPAPGPERDRARPHRSWSSRSSTSCWATSPTAPSSRPSARIAPGNREAQQYSGFLGFFAAIPFILFSVVASDLDSLVVVALALFPLTTPTTMLLVLGVSPDIPWTLVGASLVSLTLFALLATWASARIFRATVLLYGVRPSLDQLLAAIRSPN